MLVAVALAACGVTSTSSQATRPAPPPSVDPEAFFPTLPPGSTLPTEEECAARVRRSPWEPRPENRQANHTTPMALALGAWAGHSERANRELLPRITGNFTGTTDEILQWGACKWGFDENLVRAVAVQESGWRQATVGDVENEPTHCAPGLSPPCPTSFGITQVRWYIWPGTFPHARDSTALAVDYWGGLVRSCYEGYVDWLHSFTDGYQDGDLWGCVGFWYAGRWYSDINHDYIAKVQRRLANAEWRSPSFTERRGIDPVLCCEFADRAAPVSGRVSDSLAGTAAVRIPASRIAWGTLGIPGVPCGGARVALPDRPLQATLRPPRASFQRPIRPNIRDGVSEEAAWM